MRNADAPSVSVIVPTRNRPDRLAATLRTLLAQSHAPEDYEIVVVDDRSEPPVALDGLATPGSESRTGRAGAPDLRSVRLRDHRGVNGARNAGIEATRGKLVIFTDDDVLAPPNWLQAFVAAARRHPAADCFGGPYDLTEGRPGWMCRDHGLGGLAFAPESPEGPVREVWGANMAVRRSALDRIGLFDERLSGAGDEIEWQRRLQAAGGTVVFVPDARLGHVRQATELRFGAQLRQRFRREATRIDALRILDEPTPPVLRALLATIRHAVRHRCGGGLVDAAGYLGLAWGRWTRPKPDSS